MKAVESKQQIDLFQSLSAWLRSVNNYVVYITVKVQANANTTDSIQLKETGFLKSCFVQ